jgi:hypothetical protein
MAGIQNLDVFTTMTLLQCDVLDATVTVLMVVPIVRSSLSLSSCI